MPSQKCVEVDVEIACDGQREKVNRRAESEDGPHMAALEALFGFTSEQMQQVRELPTTASWCRYLEDCFQPFLTEEYAVIWSTIGLPQPQVTSHCWVLFQAVSRATSRLDDAGYSIEDVWESIKLSLDGDVELGSGGGSPIMPGAAQDSCLIAVFAVLCWGSMIVQPKLAWSDALAGPSLAIHQLPADQQGLKMDFVRRPIPAVFRNFQKAIARRQPTRRPVTGEAAVIFVSTINYHSLRTIGNVRLKWVDNMSCHLEFDSRTRTLSVFRFPSFCALTTIAGDRGVLVEELVRALCSNESEGVEELECNLQLSQEVLMSYRLLFGQSRASRKVGKALLQKMEANYDYDELLACLCTKSHKEVVKTLPETFWPVSCRDYESNLQEVDAYSSRDDFPILGSRLATIQEFNLRQQPSKLRDLWRDRRNPLQWYTFWAVIIVGGLSILLAILQLVAAIVQVVQH
ncbi:hypothetical protein F5Y12DRAFT_788172 [Xylaria sp. FL1777]|nr:hypothetical protein F5Y12DRAFT_788172 [Xylaria sp. FL1777]